jgi:hypothetical protein
MMSPLWDDLNADPAGHAHGKSGDFICVNLVQLALTTTYSERDERLQRLGFVAGFSGGGSAPLFGDWSSLNRKQ